MGADHPSARGLAQVKPEEAGRERIRRASAAAFTSICRIGEHVEDFREDRWENRRGRGPTRDLRPLFGSGLARVRPGSRRVDAG